MFAYICVCMCVFAYADLIAHLYAYHCISICVCIVIIAFPAVFFRPLCFDCCCFPWTLAGCEQAHFFPDHNKTYEGYCEAFAWLQSSPFHPACRIKQSSSGFEDSWKLMMVFAWFCDCVKLRGGDNPSNAASPCSARGTSRGCLVERWLFSTGFHGRRCGIEGSQSQFRARISESCRQRDTYAHEVDREKHSYVMARDCDRSGKRMRVHCSARSGLFRF